jgi:hypothetical protein
MEPTNQGEAPKLSEGKIQEHLGGNGKKTKRAKARTRNSPMSEKPALSRPRRLVVRISSTEAKKAELTNRLGALARIPGVVPGKGGGEPGPGKYSSAESLGLRGTTRFGAGHLPQSPLLWRPPCCLSSCTVP